VQSSKPTPGDAKIMKRYITATVASLSLLAGLLTALPSFAQSAEEVQPTSEDMVIAELVADAQGGGESEHKHHWVRLSDDQLERMVSLKDKYETSTASKRAQLHSNEQQLRNAMTAPSIDHSKLASLNDSINSLRNDLSRTKLEYMEDRAEVLTPEQRAGLHHMMLMHEAMGGNHHCGGGGKHRHGHWGHEGGHDNAMHRGPEKASDEGGSNGDARQAQSENS